MILKNMIQLEKNRFKRLPVFRYANMSEFQKDGRSGYGVDTMTAMEIIGHKPEKMHRRYNQISPADLRQAVGKLVTLSGKLHHEA